MPTVSRVVNGSGRVAEATRARIEHLLAEYDYHGRNKRPPASAGLIHVVYPRLDTSWQLAHIRGMEAASPARASRAGGGGNLGGREW